MSATSVSSSDGKEHSDVKSHEEVHCLEDVILKYDKPWWKVPHLIKLNCLIAVLTISSTSGGYDSSLLNALQSLETWREAMGHPKGLILGGISIAPAAAPVLFCFVGPYVADTYGRKVSIGVFQIFSIVGAVLSGVAHSRGFFVGARVLMGVAGLGIGANPLIAEISYPTHRSVTTSMINVCWFCGALLAAGVTYGTRNIPNNLSWQIPTYLQAVMPIILMVSLYVIPESPRYLVSKGKIEQAREMLIKYHAGGDRSPEALRFVEFELNEITAAMDLDKYSNNTRYVDLFNSKPNRRRLFIVLFLLVMTQLSGNNLISYYLNLVLNTVGISGTDEQLQVNVGLMAFNLVISASSATLANTLKRRFMFLTSASMMLGSFVIWTILSALNEQGNYKNKSLSQGVLAMIFFFNLSYDFGMNGVPTCYLNEILTFGLRTKGYMVQNLWGVLITIYNSFVNPVAMDSIGWKYYIVYCCILAIEVVVIYFFYPETSGYTLEEVAAVFGDSEEQSQIVMDALRNQKTEVSHAEVV